jgi:ABC transporter substrate binding protein (PQQ-dependent alcohol dehydrogenase system)
MMSLRQTRSLLCALLAVVIAAAAFPGIGAAADLTIGYVELKRDARYAKRRMFARYLTQSLGRPRVGAELALKEIRFHGAETGTSFKLRLIAARNLEALKTGVAAAAGDGVRFFIMDLPADVLDEVARARRDKDILIFNVSATDDELRQDKCAANLLHMIPNDAMVMDALAQFLSLRRWRKVLVLLGPAPRDQAINKAFTRAARRFGLKITDTRPYVLGHDPRKRQQNNLTLLTRKGDYDVVFVADADGEFARDVPYRTAQPRPVVGAEGLAATAWHWAWDRHGAPQLEKRFEKKAKRPMRDVDWAAWLSVKAVAEAVQRTRSTDFETLRTHLADPDLVVDGFKGNRLNFRPWDKQLRQPILIGTHNRVIERAPIEGFLHKDNNLDTLGFDRRESRCRLAGN